MTSPATAPTTTARECNCPPSVDRCAHLDGTVLYVTNVKAEVARHSKICFLSRFWGQHKYIVADGCAVPCPDCGVDSGGAKGGNNYYFGNSEADAVAAFYAAEEALLRGDA